MNQFNQNNTNHPETGKFERAMDFYVPVGVILVELHSKGYTKIETKNFSTKNEVMSLMQGEITK